MRAKKKYGQHFLINVGVVNKIVDAICIHLPQSACALEIGPGTGVLTKHLVEKIDNYKVVEIDEDMVTVISNDIPKLDMSQIIQLDILKLDISKIFDGKPFALVGNFPYNISSQLLFLMFDNLERIPVMVGMFQKEVADRVVADPGNKTYGILSVLLQCFYDCKKLFNVSKGSFNPPPKVESSVILLTRNDRKALNCDKKLFKKVVKISFNQRRKMLRNNLKGLIDDKSILAQDIYTKRAEHLTVDEFIYITETIEKERK